MKGLASEHLTLLSESPLAHRLGPWHPKSSDTPITRHLPISECIIKTPSAIRTKQNKKYKMKTQSLLALSTTILFSSCASIVSKSEYPVSLTSSPSGCQVAVKKNGTVIYQGVTPTMVTLSASKGFFQPAKYQIEFSKKGVATQTIPLTADLDGWYFGNVFFGGLLGLLIVDPATGAMWKLPENVNTSLSTLASVTSENGKTLQLVDRASVPAELQDQLIAIR